MTLHSRRTQFDDRGLHRRQGRRHRPRREDRRTLAEGFRPIVVREGVGDRGPELVGWNLFDMDAKFGDVEPLSKVLSYLDALLLENRSPTDP